MKLTSYHADKMEIQISRCTHQYQELKIYPNNIESVVTKKVHFIGFPTMLTFANIQGG